MSFILKWMQRVRLNRNNPYSRLTFLFGSGISNLAGMSSVDKITEKILTGIGVTHGTDEAYHLDESLNSSLWTPDEYVSRVLKFLSTLRPEIDSYYQQHHDPHTANYEDLYYVASQIHDSELEEYDNPAVQPFIDKILPAIQPLLIGKEGEIREKWQLHEIAEEATNYIRDIAWHLLNKEPTKLDHLNSLKEACSDSQISGVDIFTLNHDTVLERFLSKNGIQLSDGFGKPVNDVRYWDLSLFECGPAKVRLFKLHGSINWFRFRPPGGGWSDESIGIPTEYDFWHTMSPVGEMQLPVDGRPMFLAGTFNKMLQYTSGIYADLFYQFYRSLRQTNRLIVCGYGFRDKGINTQIKEWIYSSSDKKMIVIHPDPNRLKNGARGTISNSWDQLSIDGKLVPISKGIEQTTWPDIETLI
jgi:hypothetical protein